MFTVGEKQTSNELLHVEEGLLYPALQCMRKAEWVDAAWKFSETNRRIRRYSITAAGKKHLVEETSRFEGMLKGIQLVLAH